jgi:hypothetical protein
MMDAKQKSQLMDHPQQRSFACAETLMKRRGSNCT